MLESNVEHPFAAAVAELGLASAAIHVVAAVSFLDVNLFMTPQFTHGYIFEQLDGFTFSILSVVLAKSPSTPCTSKQQISKFLSANLTHRSYIELQNFVSQQLQSIN